MIVERIVKALGRGNIIVGTPDCDCHVGDITVSGDIVFKIVGIEKLSNIEIAGIVLSPNNKVEDCFSVGDEIVFRHPQTEEPCQ